MNYKIINGTILKSDPEKLYTLSEDLFVVDGKVYENLPENVRKKNLRSLMQRTTLSCPDSSICIRTLT